MKMMFLRITNWLRQSDILPRLDLTGGERVTDDNSGDHFCSNRNRTDNSVSTVSPSESTSVIGTSTSPRRPP